MAMNDEHLLCYSPLPRTTRRRRVRVLLILGLAGALGCISFRRRLIPVWQQADYLWRQRGCMNSTFPGGQIVYEEDPAGAARLLALGGGYLPPRSPIFDGGVPPWWHPPACYRPGALPSLGFSPRYDSVAFTHARRFSGEPERLVVVEIASARQGAAGHTVVLTCFVLQPATGQIGSRVTRSAAPHSSVDFNLAAGRRLRAFAGQADPDDTSHFTIKVEIDGARRTIDGWLLRDGHSQLTDRGNDGATRP